MNNVWIATAEKAGRLISKSDATVSIFDHGFTVGDGVFETIKTVNGKPFALRQHLDRLVHSASMLRMTSPDVDLVRGAISEVCVQATVSQTPVGRLRITWTSGSGVLGSDRGSGWTLVVAWAPAKTWPESAALAVSSVKRNHLSRLSGAKTTSYAENVLAIAEAHECGGDEALLLNLDGNVCEGASSNVFIVRDGVIATPPAFDGCLLGVTRNIVISQAKTEFAVEERSITLSELLEADEVFITSSTRDIQPVAKVDNREYSGDRPVTSRLIELFDEQAEEYCND